MDRHFAIEKIRFLKLNGEPHGVPHLVTRDYKEKMRVCCEFLLVLLQFFLHLVIYFHRDKSVYRDEFDYKGVLVNCIMWTWLLLVICLRVWNINQRANWVKKYPGNLWAVSFTSYLFLSSQWLCLYVQFSFITLTLNSSRTTTLPNLLSTQYCSCCSSSPQ